MTVTASAPSSRATAQSHGIGSAVRGYLTRLRGGDVGSLPAVLGFVVLVALFTSLQPETFASSRNAANLLVQAAPVIFIAMGLVFVLLLGEIDLGAGFAAGTSAAMMAVIMTKQGLPWPVAVLACVGTGLLVGFIVGNLVARLLIPSFVVTLASFLALQGVLLLVIGVGGTIPINDPVILGIMNKTLNPVLGWILFALVVGGFAANLVYTANQRRRADLPASSMVLIVIKVISLAVPLGVATYLLNLERAVNPLIKSLKGIPVVVPFTLVFVLLLTFLLSRTAFGRHVYAVGGNAEAARRAGINVQRIKILCFMIGSAMAAVGGILLGSYNNSVSPTTGGASTLLYAVGAAVIGGTSLFGGKGRVVDAILGGLVVAVIQNGLPLITQKSGVQFIVTGLVLLLAASVDAISRRRSAASGR